MNNEQKDRWGILYCPRRDIFFPQKRWEKIENVLRERNIAFDKVQSENSESVERLCNMLINNGYKTIIIVGGDSALNDAVSQAESDLAAALAADDYASALGVLAALRKPIDSFFENVMVMDDDPAIRSNNLKLLNRFVSVFANVADFGKMAKK